MDWELGKRINRGIGFLRLPLPSVSVGPKGLQASRLWNIQDSRWAWRLQGFREEIVRPLIRGEMHRGRYYRTMTRGADRYGHEAGGPATGSRTGPLGLD